MNKADEYAIDHILSQEYFTAAQIAERHGIGSNAVVKRINQGAFALPNGVVSTYKIGKQWRVTREALDHYERTNIKLGPKWASDADGWPFDGDSDAEPDTDTTWIFAQPATCPECDAAVPIKKFPATPKSSEWVVIETGESGTVAKSAKSISLEKTVKAVTFDDVFPEEDTSGDE